MWKRAYHKFCDWLGGVVYEDPWLAGGHNGLSNSEDPEHPERVFSWQGMGALLIQGVTQNDVNVLLAWLMVTSVIVVLFNLIADVLYAVLDPRIRDS